MGIKINSVKFQESGFTIEAAELCQLLKQHKCNFFELGGDMYDQTAWHHRSGSTKAREAVFLEFAEKIAPHLSGTRTFVTGGVRSVSAMFHLGQARLEGVGIGRPACLALELRWRGHGPDRWAATRSNWIFLTRGRRMTY